MNELIRVNPNLDKHVFNTLRYQMPPIITTHSPNKIFQPTIIDIDVDLNTSLQNLGLEIMSIVELMFPRIM